MNGERNEEAVVRLRPYLEGKPLFDLAGGSGIMSEFAKTCGATSYYNIDKYFNGSSQAPTSSFVRMDILDFLSRMQPMSANFTINGLDTIWIYNEAYHLGLAKELARITQSGNIVFGIEAEVLRELSRLKTYGFDKLPFLGYGDMEGVFEKRT